MAIDILRGLENLLLGKEVTENRMRCLNAVLDEQERQDDLGVIDPNRIARASQIFSSLAAKRAQNIGLQHQNCNRYHSNRKTWILRWI